MKRTIILVMMMLLAVGSAAGEVMSVRLNSGYDMPVFGLGGATLTLC